ncbi:ABC transporter permease [Demequina activiva]|uniref:ABC3 transporter permease C-terminal domain-containing protein n=1 Tax=Demequina activiva TaxID=1582364 RepID=A0A919Q211_9MICO|nr:ABC transporter permease [Demequina activiva]GIG53451.1 hypothetical protein Dac01nite_02030 [Demequina activiva]
MRPAAARLLLLNGAPAYGRLAGIVAGVAAGTAMMLVLLGAFLHLPEREDRVAWLTPDGDYAQFDASDQMIPREPQSDALLSATLVDVFDGRTFDGLALAVTPDTTVTMPADIAPPAAGEYYASPAMIELIDSVPASQLGDRWGTLLGPLPDEMLRGPSHRAVLAGVDWEELDTWSSAVVQEEFRTTGPNSASATFRIVVAMGAIALLVPMVLLISIVSALGAAERRERLATVRLIGAGRRAMAILSGLEMAVASLAGALVGVGIAAAVRPLAAQLSINGSTMTVADVTTSPAWTAVVVLGIAALGAGTAAWRAYRDDVGALGATRERAEKPVTAWRTSTLVAGIVIFAGSTAAIRWIPNSATTWQYPLILGFALIAFGIVAAGPWITRRTSLALGARTSSAAGVVAAGRLGRHPRATFRAVAGLVAAVFIVSVFAGGSSAIAGESRVVDAEGMLATDTLVTYLGDDDDAQALAEAVDGIEGVEGAAVGWFSPDATVSGVVFAADDARAIGAIDVPPSGLVAVDLFDMMVGPELSGTDRPGVAEASDADPTALEPSHLLVLTDGSREAIETARTAIVAEASSSLAPSTRVDMEVRGAADVNNELSVMAYLGMGIAIAISALALSVASVAAMLERRRTFGLLRLGGMPVRQLRQTIATEAAVPLAVTLLLSAVLGFAVAGAVLESLSDDLSLQWPDPRYWLALATSLAVAALGIVGTFSAVRRSTELESTRFE